MVYKQFLINVCMSILFVITLRCLKRQYNHTCNISRLYCVYLSLHIILVYLKDNLRFLTLCYFIVIMLYLKRQSSLPYMLDRYPVMMFHETYVLFLTYLVITYNTFQFFSSVILCN